MTATSEVHGKALASSKGILGSTQPTGDVSGLQALPKEPHELITGQANNSPTSAGPHQKPSRKCPECESKRLFKDGVDHNDDGTMTQRWLCRDCGLRFRAERKTRARPSIGQELSSFTMGKASIFSKKSMVIKGELGLPANSQVCVANARGAKNLDSTAAETKQAVGDNKNINQEAMIVSYLIHMKNQGYRDATIEAKDFQLRRLVKLGANLNDGESVKKAVASLSEATESYKLLLCTAYEGFALKNGIPWTKPKYKQSSPLPFVPHESELDALIAGSGKKTATLLRLLKETAMRLGEAWQVEWKDFDATNRTVMCKYPEKNSRSRAFNISADLTLMLQSMPQRSQFIFSCSRQPIGREEHKTHMSNLKRQKGLLGHQRKRISIKLKNPRINEINYHSFRHWKATQLYHQTKDILYVMKYLGHREVKNTLIYIDLETISFPHGGDDFHAKIARTEQEAIKLIEAGFEFVCDMSGAKLFRKRK
jgi:integrase